MTLEATLEKYHEHGNIIVYTKYIQKQVRTDMLAIARANCVLSNDARELYQDLQAYDRFESGLTF